MAIINVSLSQQSLLKNVLFNIVLIAIKIQHQW